MIQYRVGVLKLKPENYAKSDESIRKVPMEFKESRSQPTRKALFVNKSRRGDLAKNGHEKVNMFMQLKNSSASSKSVSLYVVAY